MSHSLQQQPQNNTLCSAQLCVFKTSGRSVMATLTQRRNTTDRHVGRNDDDDRKVQRLAKTFSTITIRRSRGDTLTSRSHLRFQRQRETLTAGRGTLCAFPTLGFLRGRPACARLGEPVGEIYAQTGCRSEPGSQIPVT